jgi:hypothetical protein
MKPTSRYPRKKKRVKSKTTKTYQAKQLRKLMKKCYDLWALVVKKRAGNVCEIGKFYGYICSGGFLNAHHIESKRNKALRFAPEDGLSTCPGHHKFYNDSCHKSFLVIYEYMRYERPNDINYLLTHQKDKVELTKEYLEDKIREFSRELYGSAGEELL